MINKDPIISVIMPVYNAGKFLAEAIESILNQTYKDFELIIINDGSTDNSDDIVRSYLDKRIRYYFNKNNKGIIYTLNYGLTLAKGKFIARMDADDISLKNRFEKQIGFLIQNPDLALLGTSVLFIDYKGLEINTLNVYLEEHLLFSNLFFNNAFVHTSIIGKTEIFRRFKYNENYYLAEDYFLWSQIASEFKVANLAEPLVKYRVHEDSISIRKQEEQEECVKKVFSYHLTKLKLSDCSDSQLKNHYMILRYKFNRNTLTWDENKAILKWLDVLKIQNEKLKVYNSIYFYDNLNSMWKFYFMSSARFGIKAIYFVLNGFNNDLTLKTKLLFVLKCFKSDVLKVKNKLQPV